MKVSLYFYGNRDVGFYVGRIVVRNLYVGENLADKIIESQLSEWIVGSFLNI